MNSVARFTLFRNPSTSSGKRKESDFPASLNLLKGREKYVRLNAGRYTKIFLLLISVVTGLHAHIVEIYSMQDAQKLLQQADEHTMVLFDIDETLWAPNDKIFHYKFYTLEHIAVIKKSFKQKLGERYNLVWDKAWLHCSRMLLEPMIVDIINELQARKITTLGLTKSKSNMKNIIDSVIDFRCNQLQKLGINFHKSHNITIEFNQCPQNYGSFPIAHKGIIFTNEISKGVVLGHFLDTLDYVPKQIIFFDDWLDNLISVEEELSRRGILFYGFHYKAIENFPGTINPEVVQYQLDHLYEHEVWLSEEEAHKLMNAII